ncbi:MAG: tyrosine-type recombinase/integrase [Elusimicrobia bacterium]|nr:tyrosine-type recombinase/integrase [Elusimicrobiota bacterium]
MLSKFFDSDGRVHALRIGPAGGLLDGFAHVLWQAGYAQITARGHLRAAEHFVAWADRKGISVGSLTEQTLELFGRHLSRCRCPRYGHTKPNLVHGARMFVRHLEEAGIIKLAVVASRVPNRALMVAFCQWMRERRGTCESTLYNYGVHIRELLRRLGEEPEKFDARGLRQFVIEGKQACGWAAAKTRTTALRMFLRFLIAEGKCASRLEAAIPVLAHWRLASLPRYLQPAEVERLIASCDPASPVGLRDRAILLLLARLGLRAGDIVHLRLQDIDWKGGWIHVCGKGRRQTRLPLAREVGQALVTYLKDGRPWTEADTLFVRCRAPFRAFGSHCAVSMIVSQALRRAHVARPSRGAAHLLRHSLATSMLRQGATLQDIAAILRHRSIETTQIYAKVDVTALRKIAQPWPEVRPC